MKRLCLICYKSPPKKGREKKKNFQPSSHLTKLAQLRCCHAWNRCTSSSSRFSTSSFIASQEVRAVNFTRTFQVLFKRSDSYHDSWCFLRNCFLLKFEEVGNAEHKSCVDFQPGRSRKEVQWLYWNQASLKFSPVTCMIISTERNLLIF